MKAMEIFLTAYSFVQSSGSSWEHKVRASMAASLEKTEPASRVAHEGRPQQQDARKTGEFACLVNVYNLARNSLQKDNTHISLNVGSLARDAHNGPGRRARSKFIFRISSLCNVGLSAHEICIESSCKGHNDNCPDKYLIYIHRTHGIRIFFRGQSDWFSMRSVFSYLFPRAMVTLS